MMFFTKGNIQKTNGDSGPDIYDFTGAALENVRTWQKS